jgi:hypothetical protein
MARKEFEADDPMELVGVVLPADAEATRDMAYVFAEEFARLGFDSRRILRLFRQPFYAAAYQAYCALGEDAVRRIIEECTQIWGRVRISDSSPGDQEGA